MLILSVIFAVISGFSLIVCLVFLPIISLTIPVGIIFVLNVVSIFIKKNKKIEIVVIIVLGILTLFALLGGLSVLQAY